MISRRKFFSFLAAAPVVGVATIRSVATAAEQEVLVADVDPRVNLIWSNNCGGEWVSVPVPKDWDKGTVTINFDWSQSN